MKKITLLFAALLVGGITVSAQQTISFEASEGYSLGDINGQNSWTVTGDGSGGFISGQVITDEMATDGTNSFKIDEDLNFSPQQSMIMGGFYNYATPLEYSGATFSADMYMSEVGGANFGFGLVSTTAQSYVALLFFDWEEEVFVIDGGAAVGTGFIWQEETWYDVRMEITGSSIAYFIDDVQIYSGNLIVDENIEQARFVHDNWGGFAYIDNFVSTAGALSVGSQTLSQVSIYPTPAVDVINISTPASMEINQVMLYDLQGRNTGAVFTDGTVNVSGLSRGVYMLTVETSEGTLTQKVVKK